MFDGLGGVFVLAIEASQAAEHALACPPALEFWPAGRSSELMIWTSTSRGLPAALSVRWSPFERTRPAGEK